jgi:hypothetical protein
MPIGPPPPEVLEKLQAVADEQVRDVFKRIGTLKAEAIAKKIEYLLNHDDWRANVEGIKLRARIAGDYAAEEVKVTPQRAEDLGGMDDVLSQLPQAMLLAIATRTGVRGALEE